MSIAAGTRLGRYEVRLQIGAGGMGEVYLAHDTTELERAVAVKVLPAEIAADPKRMRRFIQEAQTASSLNHPNILTVHEIGEAHGTRFLVTEYVEGETLRQKMSRSRLTLHEALDVAAQIASALVAAHKVGVVHRDIKPENVMLREDGIVKVLDFGLAKLTGSPADQSSPPSDAATRAMVNTSPGLIMGTVAYMSPEQARGLSVDERTDIWSLGVVIYEMVSGRVPFEGPTTTDVLAAILHREPPSLLLTRRDVPSELGRIVEKALAKDHEDRYQFAKELGVDLKRLRRRLEVEAELERSATPDRGSGGRRGGGTTRAEAAQTGGGNAHTAPGAQYITQEIKRHKRTALLIMGALAVTTVIIAYLAYSRYFTYGGEGGVGAIAVLPFANTSNDPETEYLSDGISESLINSLSQLPQLKVIARSSSFKYKGREVDPREAAKALGVQTIVTGKVVQRGEQLEVSAEMVNAREGTQLWGKHYNSKAADLLSVQAAISSEIAERLRIRLTGGERQRLAKRETGNPEAYEMRLKGRFYQLKGGVENRKKAVEYFQQATAADPSYAAAHADLSFVYSYLVANSVLDPREFTPKAEAEARKALELDGNLAEAHYALANLKTDAWDWASAERGFKRAIELNPNSTRARNGYANYLSIMGRHDEAVAEQERSREIDPLSLSASVNLGWMLFFARRYDQAIEVLKRTLELEHNLPFAHVYLGYAYAAKGMYREAIASYQEAIKLGEDTPSVQIYLGAAYAREGEREQAGAILKQLQTGREYVSPGELVVLYAALGERERALASLEKAYSAHDLQLQFLGVDPAFDSLREDPRFQDIMRKVGLPR